MMRTSCARILGWTALALSALLLSSRAVDLAAQAGPKRPPITGVASFAAKVADMAEARKFYSGVLGLEEAFTIKNPIGGSDLTTFKINDNQYVYIAPDLKDPNENRLLFVGFETTDARALRAYLASKGIEVPAVVTPDPQGNLSLFVKDPEGNTVQFIQYQAASVHGKSKGKFLSPAASRITRSTSATASWTRTSSTRSTRTSSAIG